VRNAPVKAALLFTRERRENNARVIRCVARLAWNRNLREKFKGPFGRVEEQREQAEARESAKVLEAGAKLFGSARGARNFSPQTKQPGK